MVAGRGGNAVFEWYANYFPRHNRYSSWVSAQLAVCSLFHSLGELLTDRYIRLTRPAAAAAASKTEKSKLFYIAHITDSAAHQQPIPQIARNLHVLRRDRVLYDHHTVPFLKTTISISPLPAPPLVTATERHSTR